MLLILAFWTSCFLQWYLKNCTASNSLTQSTNMDWVTFFYFPHVLISNFRKFLKHHCFSHFQISSGRSMFHLQCMSQKVILSLDFSSLRITFDGQHFIRRKPIKSLAYFNQATNRLQILVMTIISSTSSFWKTK